MTTTPPSPLSVDDRPLAERATTTTRATTPARSAVRSARKRYWEDAVHDALGELRRRLVSTRESVVTLALLTIIEVEKHRMRHGRPVSGTETSHVRDDEDPHPLPKLAPLDAPEAGASRPVAGGRPVGVADPDGAGDNGGKPSAGGAPPADPADDCRPAATPTVTPRGIMPTTRSTDSARPTGPRTQLRLEALDDRITPALSFNTQVPFDTGGANATAAAVADFNGDGRPDVAATNGGANTVSFLVNTTPDGGAPTFVTTNGALTGAGPGAVAAGDFNGDGRTDVVVANSAANTVSVYLNTTPAGAATPTFLGQQTFGAGANPAAVAVADFNGDGRADIAVSAGQLAILLNGTARLSATAAFSTQVITTITNRGALAVADFNADGRADVATSDSVLVTGGNYVNTVRVWSNLTPAGGGTINFAQSPAFTGSAVPTVVTYPLAAGDFNGDGRPDLAVTDGGNTVSVLSNQTVTGFLTPTFAGPQTFALGADARGAALAGDFDGDGRTDLAAAVAGNAVAVLTNTSAAVGGIPAFAAPQAFATGPNPRMVVGGDFDADGRVDLATPNGDASTVSVLRNSSSAISVTAPALIAQFGTQGVWRYNRGGTWDQLTQSNANALASNAAGRAVGAFGTAGVWYFDPTAGWFQINGNAATAVAMDAHGSVYASFPGFGVAVYRRSSGWSSVLTGSVANMLAANAQGDVAANFPGFGVYRFTGSTGWVQITGNTAATTLAVANNGDVAVSFNGFGVYQFKTTAGWLRLNTVSATSVAFGGDDAVAANFAGVGVARYVTAAGWWQPLNSGAQASSVAMDLYGNAAVVYPGFGVYEYSPVFGFRLRTGSVATVLAFGR